MLVRCPQCETRFAVSEQQLGPRGRSLRCSQCRTVFFQPPSGAPILLDEPPAVPPPRPAAVPVPAPARAPSSSAPPPAAKRQTPPSAPPVRATMPAPAAQERVDGAGTLVLSAPMVAAAASTASQPRTPPRPADDFVGLDDLDALSGGGMDGLDDLEGLDGLDDLEQMLDGLDHKIPDGTAGLEEFDAFADLDDDQERASDPFASTAMQPEPASEALDETDHLEELDDLLEDDAFSPPPSAAQARNLDAPLAATDEEDFTDLGALDELLETTPAGKKLADDWDDAADDLAALAALDDPGGLEISSAPREDEDLDVLAEAADHLEDFADLADLLREESPPPPSPAAASPRGGKLRVEPSMDDGDGSLRRDLDAELGLGSGYDSDPEFLDSGDLPDLDDLLTEDREPSFADDAEETGISDADLEAGLFGKDDDTDAESLLDGLMAEEGGGAVDDLDALLNEEGDGLEDLDGLLAGEDAGRGQLLEEIDLGDEELLGDDDMEGLLGATGRVEEIDLDAETIPSGKKRLSAAEEDALGALGMAGANRLTGAEEDALASLGLREMDDEPDTLLNPAYQKKSTIMDEDALTLLAGAGRMIPAQPDDDDEETPKAPPRRRGGSQSPPPKKRLPLPRIAPWPLAAMLALTLIGTSVYRLEAVEAWRYGLRSTFQAEKVEGEWKKLPAGMALVLTGQVINTTRLSQHMPFVKFTLLNGENKELAQAKVAPGRILSDADMGAEAPVVRTMIELQSKEKGLAMPKALPEKAVPFQVIFLDPPPETARYKMEWEFHEVDAKRAGGTKNFQSAF
ncbi:MAG: zinc-ribbon domain-containing protein [Magnetococcales bacterium]|nr:zinc-ribbon domain-containing protein [Magnetococcales bacterium]